ncbi:MAG: membrane protein insertion efficiency factor YidD [Pseudanabaena sp. ELA607]|jgi:putative component of membrane protein insertase Oxa1/YidC/SpoIIIJ protein YidD
MISLRSRFPRNYSRKTRSKKAYAITDARATSRYLGRKTLRQKISRHPLSQACDHATRYLGVALISIYQKFISPHKGFRCAHRVLHGGESCSSYIKRIAADEGVITALRALKPRFAECRCAYETIKERRQQCAKAYTSERLNQLGNQLGSSGSQFGTFALAMNSGGDSNLGDPPPEPSEPNGSPHPEDPESATKQTPQGTSEPPAPAPANDNSACCTGAAGLGDCLGDACIQGACAFGGELLSSGCDSACSAADCGSCG